MRYKSHMKILWAVDALDPYPENMSKIVRVLDLITKTGGAEIYPVYVLSPEQLGLATDFNPPMLESQIEDRAQKALNQCMQDIRLSGLKKPELVIHHRNSLKGSVGKLVDYAEKNRFDLIIEGTHGRNGVQRAFMGSFAEELLLQSRTPVLVVGPSNEISTDTENRILIPTDLEHPGSAFIKKAFKFSSEIKAKVSLLHAIPRPIETFFQSGVYLLAGSWVPVPMYIKEEKLKQEPKMALLTAEAKAAGLSCDSLVDHECNGIVESILNQVKSKKITFIALEAQSGKISSLLLGSITRKLVRESPVPVWVFRAS